MTLLELLNRWNEAMFPDENQPFRIVQSITTIDGRIVKPNVGGNEELLLVDVRGGAGGTVKYITQEEMNADLQANCRAATATLRKKRAAYKLET